MLQKSNSAPNSPFKQHKLWRALLKSFTCGVTLMLTSSEVTNWLFNQKCFQFLKCFDFLFELHLSLLTRLRDVVDEDFEDRLRHKNLLIHSTPAPNSPFKQHKFWRTLLKSFTYGLTVKLNSSEVELYWCLVIQL